MPIPTSGRCTAALMRGSRAQTSLSVAPLFGHRHELNACPPPLTSASLYWHSVPPCPRQVLILAERLTRATLAFDRLRAARYQALVAAQQPPPAPSASGAGGGAAAVDGRGGAGHRHGRTQVRRAKREGVAKVPPLVQDGA